jgi:ribosomal protein S12 methylthiotransferase
MNERRDRVMEAQQEIAFAFNRTLVGKKLDVLIDGPAPGIPASEHVFAGRSYADAPDVDGVTYVRGRDLEPGDLVPCEIVGAEGYDLAARPVAEAAAGAEVLHGRKRRRPKPRTRPGKPSSPFTIL